MRSRRMLLTVVALFALLAALVATAVPAAVESTASADGHASNVLVTITLGKLEDGDLKPLRTYQILAPGSGTPTRLGTTNRIPIPAIALSQDNEGRTLPTSSFSYQNVGFQANIRATTLGGNLVKVTADIDDSALYNPSDIDRGKPGSQAAPVVTGFTQSIEAVLRAGAPVVSTLVDDPKGQSLYIQLGAEIQR